MNKHETYFSELIVEINRYKRSVQSDGITFERSSTAIHVLQLSVERYLLEATA